MSVAGLLADRFSRSRIIVISLVLWSLATLAVAPVRGLSDLLTARVVFGVTQCLYVPASLALIADHHGPATRGVAMSLNIAGMSGGMIAGGTLTGYIAQTWGWRYAFRCSDAWAWYWPSRPFLVRDGEAAAAGAAGKPRR